MFARAELRCELGGLEVRLARRKTRLAGGQVSRNRESVKLRGINEIEFFYSGGDSAQMERGGP